MVLGLCAGAALGASGAAMQGFFRNPLADPGLIGVSAGGAVAAGFGIVLGGGLLAALPQAVVPLALPLAAFAGALAVVLSIYRLSLLDGRVIVATMLLAGVAANALAFSGIGYMTFLADDAQLRDLTFWTLGSLGGATWDRVLPAVVLMAVSVAGLMGLARPLNGLLFGEADAAALGIDVEDAKRRAALFTALGVGAATAVCGIVSFVGLVVPHLVRLMTGPDHRYVLPGSALLGAALILLADLVARLAVVPAELPLGVVTAAIGAPFFFWLLFRDKKRSALG
jgi:iron complex transport system permease protein